MKFKMKKFDKEFLNYQDTNFSNILLQLIGQKAIIIEGKSER